MDEDDKGIDLLDVKAALERVFQGCSVSMPSAMGGSHHAEVSFSDYEVRVILTGPRAPDRPIHFRFMQRITPKAGQRPIKVIHNEIQTRNPKDLLIAIRDAREYLQGQAQMISKALNPPPAPSPIRTVDDIF